MAAGLDQGKVSPDTTYEDKGAVKIEGWSGLIKNSDYDQKGGHGVVDMNAVLELSLNTGVIFVMQKTGPEVFAEYVKNFGFGEKTGIELETEGDGNISTVNGKKIRPIEAATATFGQGLTVTPLQMAMAYAAIANDGVLMKPYVVKEIKKSSGEVATTQPQIVRRVISSRTAALLGAMMVNVVEKGHGTKAGVKGYYIGGKTGTAQVPKKGGGYEANAHIGSFAGFGPVENPRFVMLVKINNPRDVMWAESSAAPLFGDIAQFILNYYQVPKER
jgi:cell division protein FtsI (penicillin-binding protein 3)/stage V sporulation protein D (sporulation-specific penicillin-binding protein)